MRTLDTAAPRRRLAALAAVLALVAAVAACAPGAPADGPAAVVNEALAKVAAKDLDGLRTLACAGQEDMIRDQFGIAGALDAGALVPGLDTEALMNAVTLDVKGVKLGDAAIDGDVAQVPVTGTMKVTFDAAVTKPLLRTMLESQGTTMTDEQLDALLRTLASYGQDLPIDETVRLVRESGAWKLCLDIVPVPAAS
jgi:hypothetical protein